MQNRKKGAGSFRGVGCRSGGVDRRREVCGSVGTDVERRRVRKVLERSEKEWGQNEGGAV